MIQGKYFTSLLPQRSYFCKTDLSLSLHEHILRVQREILHRTLHAASFSKTQIQCNKQTFSLSLQIFTGSSLSQWCPQRPLKYSCSAHESDSPAQQSFYIKEVKSNLPQFKLLISKTDKLQET